ncbi:MAG: BMP family ABC transporter substrate-binding protein [Lawsonibacter sp.]|nr:BMP family ABC transporter substrate-binding protein [Lawsonibacter sp.]
MKKLLALALAAAMSLSLCACGGGNSSGGSTSGNAGGSAPQQGSATAPEGESDGFKVGAIYINSQNDTAGYTFQHHNGITTAMKNLGLDPATDLLIVDNVKEDYTAVSNAVDTLANQGANIIFGISFGYIDAMNDKAEDYPDIAFSHATGYMSNDTNFNNYFGRIYQARYLAGIAAGMKSLEIGNNAIGYVAAYNLEYAETCSGINGFALGAQSVNPDAVIYVNKIDTWGDENLERQAAQALIDTYHCGVISQHCDSAQPQLVAAENSAFGCGYNSDMTEQAPAAHLTSAIWHWNVYYETAIHAAMGCTDQNGKVDGSHFVDAMGGNAYYAGLAEGFVDASPLNESIAAPNTQAVMDAVRELIVSGSWDVFSGVKLSYNIGEDGSVEVVQTEAPLMSNGYELKDGEVVEMANPEIVPAGGPSVDDGVIKGSMNYNVAGVVTG